MRTAIAYALAWPERVEAGVAPLDLLAIARLEFEAPDRTTFRCLDLAYQALAAGGSASTALNAANEEAVAAFLEGRLPFLAIAETIERCLAATDVHPVTDLASILDADLTARRQARRIIDSLSGSKPLP
jgi:1-deoxy-D-xylulose-5-phosphate reductoisomerase